MLDLWNEIFEKSFKQVIKANEVVPCIVDDMLVFGTEEAVHDTRLYMLRERFNEEMK